MLVAHTLKMNDVIKVIIKYVHFNKKKFHHSQFKSFLKECKAACENVLYFAAVQWLNKGATLGHFFSLRKVITVDSA